MLATTCRFTFLECPLSHSLSVHLTSVLRPCLCVMERFELMLLLRFEVQEYAPPCECVCVFVHGGGHCFLRFSNRGFSSPYQLEIEFIAILLPLWWLEGRSFLFGFFFSPSHPSPSSPCAMVRRKRCTPFAVCWSLNNRAPFLGGGGQEVWNIKKQQQQHHTTVQLCVCV